MAPIPEQEVLGLKSSTALLDVMAVDPIPELPASGWLRDYIAHVENGTQSDPAAREVHKRLLKLYGPDHPVMRDVERLARFQAFKLRRPPEREG